MSQNKFLSEWLGRYENFKIHLQDGDYVLFRYPYKEKPLNDAYDAFLKVKEILPENVKLIAIPDDTSLQTCTQKDLVAIRDCINDVLDNSRWACETCINYPPLSCDGKPCSICDPNDPLLNCYQKKPEDETEI